MENKQNTKDIKNVVSIVVITHNRLRLVQSAIETILNQNYPGMIECLLCFDGCTYKETLVAKYAQTTYPNRTLKFVDMQVNQNLDISERLAYIRNQAVARTEGHFIGFLDDDNLFLSDHVSSLLQSLNMTKADAAHSWRRILNKKGLPWYADHFPWSMPENREAEFDYYCNQGVLHPGSDILRDCTLLRNGEIGMVDTSCWMFRREVLERIPFPETRTPSDIAQRQTEDDLLLREIVKANISVASTCLPTLLYRLGGYSNT